MYRAVWVVDINDIEFLDNGIMGTLGLLTMRYIFYICCNIVSAVGCCRYLFIIVCAIFKHSFSCFGPIVSGWSVQPEFPVPPRPTTSNIGRYLRHQHCHIADEALIPIIPPLLALSMGIVAYYLVICKRQCGNWGTCPSAPSRFAIKVTFFIETPTPSPQGLLSQLIH